MEEFKDLGGLVNKDLAFSKLPQEAVLDSVNFRITTEDGNTAAARQNIKGNKNIAGLSPGPCIQTLVFDVVNINAVLTPGTTYDFILTVNNVPAPTLSIVFSSASTLITDVTNFINTDLFFVPFNISALAGTDRITITLPNCDTIAVSSFGLPGGPAGLSLFPYTVFDEEFAIETFNGNSYNANAGFVPPPQWYITDFTPSTTFTTQMTTGVYSSTATLVNLSATVLRTTMAGNAVDSEVLWTCDPLYISNINSSSPSLFDYFTGGPYQIDFGFYSAKTANTELRLRIYLDLGPFVDPVAAATYGITLENIPAVGYNLIVLDDFTIAAGVNDVNYIGAPYTFSFNPAGLANLKNLLASGSGYYYNGFYIRANAQGAAPGAYSATLYLDRFRVQGPVLNFASMVSVQTTAVPATFGFIIGWTALRDDIYLFTTDGIFDPDDPTTWGGPTPPTTSGQIWKFSYDKAGDYADPANYQLTLVYSNQLNFTTSRPIANPGMIESRYESPSIQKIYWTDNYNVPRQINVADPNVASLTVEQLNLQPSLSMDIPILSEVLNGGELLVGVYQVAYRLKNTNGSETRFSRTSNLIPIIEKSEGISNELYFPQVSGATTPGTAGSNVREDANKSIKISVSNLDTTYDTIEFATLYYFDDTSVPIVNIIKEEFIPASGFVETTITGAEDVVPITVDEFTAFNTFIKRAKTLAAKKQTLFLGNISTASQEVPFDSRAYRFPKDNPITYIYSQAANQFFSVDSSGGNYYYDGTTNQVPDTHDAIQSYANQSPDISTNYLYLPNSDILGGEGPNIRFEFVTQDVILDTIEYSSTAPYRKVNTINQVINLGDHQYENLSYTDYNSPFIYDMLVGYRRDEMYRFGIVFFDELDNPTYVNWIADIRMPHIYMPGDSAGSNYPASNRSTVNYTAVGSEFSSAIVSYDAPTQTLTGKPLGIKFTIKNFTGIPAQYKKAMIVRTPLRNDFKHILGQGALQFTWKSDGIPAPYGDTGVVYTCNPYLWNVSSIEDADANEIWNDSFTLRSPEFLFKSFEGSSTTDRLDVLGVLEDIVPHIPPTGLNFPMNQGWLRASWFNTSTAPWMSPRQQSNQNYYGYLSKNYTIKESATIPYSIKDTVNTQNPYRVYRATQIYNNWPNEGFNTVWNTGASVPAGVTVGNRILKNCSPRDGNNIDGNNNTGIGGPVFAPDIYSHGNNSLFIQLDVTTYQSNFNFVNPGTEAYYRNTKDGWAATAGNTPRNIYFANYRQDVASPFGGQTFFARSNSEYIACNNLIDISNRVSPVSLRVFGGDTKVTVLDHVMQFTDLAKAVYYPNTLEFGLHFALFPVETSVAVDYRRTSSNRNPADEACVPNISGIGPQGGPDATGAGWSGPHIDLQENFEVDPVFNHTDKSVYRYFPKPALIQVPIDFDCRVWRSEKKIDGELTESWSIFKPSSFLDVESAYGPLNNLVVFQDKLYFIQDRAFGVLQVAEQKLITDQGGNADLVLGSSGILERYDYISTKTGTKHQFSMYASDYSMVWFDTLARKLYRYKPGALEPLTDIKGYNGFLYNRTNGFLQTRDNPYRMVDDPIQGVVWRPHGVHSTYDFRHNEFFMTFLNPDDPTLPNDPDNYVTLVYNDLFDGFVGEYTHYPKVYINDKVNIFSPYLPIGSSFDSIFIHNYGDYGRFYNSQVVNYSTVSFVVNNNPTLEKTFTNLEVVAEAYSQNLVRPSNNPHLYDPFASIDYYNFFEDMRVFDNYQNTDWIPLSILSRRHKTIWNIKVPSDRVIDVTNNIFDPANLAAVRPSITRRMKDKWFVVELRYNNTPNNKFVVHTAKAIYSANSR